MKLIKGVVAVFLTIPIWFYLLYQILVRVQATELMFFLFWIYVPATVIVSVISVVLNERK